jgi:uncharacterized protein (DUF58 family)
MRFIRSLYLNNRFLYSASAISLLFFISYFASELFFPASIMLLVLVILLIVDMLLLYSGKYEVISHRILADRFSNGDDNEVKLIVTNSYPYEVKIRIIDELPVEFQIRDFEILSYLESNQTKYYSYNIRPVKRGEYTFGAMNIYVKARIGLISRPLNLIQ